MDTYSTGRSIGRNYDTTNRTRAEKIMNGVYPENVRDYARPVLEDVDPSVSRYRYAAALTRYVHNEIETTGGEGNKQLFSPDYVLNYGIECDCEDAAVLLSSLLEVRSFDTRFLDVVNDGYGNHLMVQTRFPADSVQEIVEDAKKFYQNENLELFYQVAGDDVWLLCDPIFSPVAGTTNDDFLERVENGRIEIRDETSYDVFTPNR